MPRSDAKLKPEETDWDEEVCPGLDAALSRDGDGTVRTTRSGGESSVETCESILLASANHRHHSSFRVNGADSSKRNLKVKFSYIHIRYYQRALEINPAVTNGPAIGIGWRYKRGGKMLVEDYEAQRGGHPRTSQELILPRPIREKILVEAGYDQKQIAEAIRIIRKAKDRRKVTAQNLGTSAEAMEETVEAAARRFKGLLSFGKRSGLV